MKNNRILYLTLFLVFSIKLICQNNKNSDSARAQRHKAIENYKKNYSIEYKKTILDSIEFKGELLDMNFGGSCGVHKRSGVFVFKVKERIYGKCPDTLIVVIQCAQRELYYKLLLKGHSYLLRVSQNILNSWVDTIWEPYKDFKRYYILEKNLTKLD